MIAYALACTPKTNAGIDDLKLVIPMNPAYAEYLLEGRDHTFSLQRNHEK